MQNRPPFSVFLSLLAVASAACSSTSSSPAPGDSVLHEAPVDAGSPIVPPVTPAATYAVGGKQYVMAFTGEGQSVSAGPLGLTQKSMPAAVRGHNSVFVFTLPDGT